MLPDSNNFLLIPASVADDVDVNPIDINRPFLNGGSRFFIILHGKTTFINAPRILPRNPLDCITLNSCVFDNFTSTDDVALNSSFSLTLVTLKNTGFFSI